MIGFNHKLPKAKLVYQRHPFIVDYCKGKCVLHIGCVDVGLMHERYESGQLLHQKLDEVSSNLWGIDIDEEGVNFLASKGFNNVFTVDITENSSLEEFVKQKFDVIVFSEVIEHLLSPGIMLSAIRNIMTDETRLLITAPNAYSISAILSMMKGIERVHPDHNYYFSHVTLRCLVNKSELVVEDEALYTFLGAEFLPKSSRDELIVYDASANNKSTNTKIKNEQVLPRWYQEKPNVVVLYKRVLNRLKRFVERSLIKYLFSKTNYWGDGIIFICKKN